MENIEKIISESFSINDVCLKIYGYSNGRNLEKTRKIIESSNIETTHFGIGKKNIKYERIEKICPVCDKKFETHLGARKEKTTCSHSCSNTYFRAGKNNGNWSDDSYRSTCFFYHKKECIICGENKIVEVHHMDENKKNNSPENLVPLCPTHHQYWHSRYKQEIEEKIYNYINEFKMTTLTQYQQQQQINRTD